MTSTATLQFEPTSHSTLVQEVTDQLLSLMLEGQLQPGDRLPSQKELTQQLQVGRSTVREALRTLDAMGLVALKQGHGTFVKQLDARSIIRPDIMAHVIDRQKTEQLFEARQIIEPAIAALASERATAQDLAAIEQAWQACRSAQLAGRPLHRLSPNYHRAIAQAAHSEILAMFVGSILVPLEERGMLLEKKPGYLDWELESHWRVYEAIVSRNPEHATVVMAQHLVEARAALLEMLV